MVRLDRVLGVSFVALTILGVGALLAPWVLYAMSSPFPGRLEGSVAFSVVIGRELWTSCLRMPEKATIAPSRDWTVVAVGFAYLGVLYACLAEVFLRRQGLPAFEVAAAGASVYLGGLWLRQAALRRLGKHWSVQLDRSENPDSALVRSGPYAWIRHPVYLGAMLESVGVALFFGSLAALAIAVVCFCPAELARASFEERVLLTSLGDAYRTYRHEVGGFVPRRLFRGDDGRRKRRWQR